MLVIDEAQKIPNIGTALKLIVDHIPDIAVLATGSSSFDLVYATAEPLTGRKNVLTLYPIALGELANHTTSYNMQRNLSDYLIYGMYPDILQLPTYAKKERRIREIKDSYLIKDILEFHRVKQAKPIIDLLKLLAFQIGSEVSLPKLGKALGIDHKTVAHYLDLLEKAFVLFRLGGFSRNMRKEVTKMSKYYFYDLGIRNALIANFNDLDTRDDLGQLWENFVIMEKVKANAYAEKYPNYYFWRTYDKHEIDMLEEQGGRLYAYECKWKSHKVNVPQDFLAAYPNAEFSVINRDNLLDHVL
jgi:hypothetical protein